MESSKEGAYCTEFLLNVTVMSGGIKESKFSASHCFLTFVHRMHYQTHGYGGVVEPSVGMLCATLNRFNKQFCRVRIESVASSGTVGLTAFIAVMIMLMINVLYSLHNSL